MTPPSTVTFKTPRALEFHLPNIFFQISKFTFAALSPPSPFLSPSFFSFFPSLSKHRKYFSTLVSLYVGRKIREIPTRHTEREREKQRAQRGNITLDYFRDRIRHDISTEPLSLFLSLSLSQADFIKASGGSFKKNSWRKTK